MESGGSNMLVILDQHAVHERVKLEQLTASMYLSTIAWRAGHCYIVTARFLHQTPIDMTLPKSCIVSLVRSG